MTDNKTDYKQSNNYVTSTDYSKKEKIDYFKSLKLKSKYTWNGKIDKCC